MITARLVELRNMGISLAIDDFGMEYSSLNRIKSFPIDRLKIDMNFVQGILTNSKDRAIVEVIISLAKTLNLKVIAEVSEHSYASSEEIAATMSEIAKGASNQALSVNEGMD